MLVDLKALFAFVTRYQLNLCVREPPMPRMKILNSVEREVFDRTDLPRRSREKVLGFLEVGKKVLLKYS